MMDTKLYPNAVRTKHPNYETCVESCAVVQHTVVHGRRTSDLSQCSGEQHSLRC